LDLEAGLKLTTSRWNKETRNILEWSHF